MRRHGLAQAQPSESFSLKGLPLREALSRNGQGYNLVFYLLVNLVFSQAKPLAFAYGRLGRQG